MRFRKRKSRGVILLVSLSLLVLFLLLTVTFVLATGQFFRTSQSVARSKEYYDDGKELCDDCIKGFVRGVADPVSPHHFYSLLGQFYGNDSIRGKVETVNDLPGSSGQFVEVTITVDAGYKPDPLNDYYNGCVMTMLDGPADGLSRRIVDYFQADSDSYTFHVETFGSTTLPEAENLVLINGRPFNGKGNGYNANPMTGGRNDAMDPNDWPYALLPNLLHFQPTSDYLAPGGPGDFDVEYVAPDYNHPWLAASGPNPALSKDIKPSWHDPALFNYWAAQSGTSELAIPLALARKISFRPLGRERGTTDTVTDHPNFTGGTPNFNPKSGPWDVDNDNDGVPDSVWIDLGYPVRKSREGRLYRPLFAILARDQCGRVNINVAGTKDMYNSAYFNPFVPLDPPAKFFAGGGTEVTLPRGQGYGPWEINPYFVLSSSTPGDTTALTEQQRLLEGGVVTDANDVDQNVLGRFGPAASGVFGPGAPGQQDLLNAVLMTNLYGNAIATSVSGSNFGTPVDLKGHGLVALDLRGQPVFGFMGEPAQWVDNPSEQAVDYSMAGSALDKPFTLEEFSAGQRLHDPDASGLPQRAIALAPRLTVAPEEWTVASWDLPVPNMQAPKHLRPVLLLNGMQARHISDLLRARVMIAKGYTSAPLDDTQRNDVNGIVNGLLQAKAVSPDLLSGLRMDVNRLFGNGLDDDGDGIIDEPDEAGNSGSPELVYPAGLAGALPGTTLQTQFGSISFDHNGDGSINDDDRLARYEYAKQLYILLMLLADEGTFPDLVPATESLSDDQKKELVARRLAQYAINVVDFRDPDAIMTPFEYDRNPWDGWSVDGVLDPSGADAEPIANPDRRVVWGCEAPAVLLSEAIAFHNVRLDDTSENNKTTDTPPNKDDHYDTVGLPEGSLFVELYSPANPYRWGVDAGGNQVFLGSRDIYTAAGVVDLGKKTSNQLPVWRIAVSAVHLSDPVSDLLTLGSATYKPESTTLQPEKMNVFPLDQPNNPTQAIERVIWFANTNPDALDDAVLMPEEKAKVFFNRTSATTTLGPGQYLVVGPRETTALGKLSDGSGTDGNQKIRLTGGSFEVTTMDAGASELPDTSTHIQQPLAIICAANRPATAWIGDHTPQAIGVNISEPLPNGTSGSYYPEPWDDATNVGKNNYQPAKDIPQDAPGLGVDSPASQVYAQGTTLNFRTLFLQRLADPTKPFHQVTNPYITVDFMPVDLTMFNGDSLQFDHTNDTTKAVRLRTRERGDSTNFNLWAPAIGASKDPVATTGSDASHFFQHDLRHSLGFLNDAFTATPSTTTDRPQLLTAPTDVPSGSPFIGGLRDTNPLSNPPNLPIPFPWIAWFDRPYISQYELLQVPASSPQRLNDEFSNAVIYPGTNPYETFNRPYRHLLNFFLTNTTFNNDATNPNFNQFARIFDYLGVPSKYAEAQMVLNPKVFSTGDAADTGRFRPPFNVLSRYREPGRVNLCTIFSPNVFNALMNDAPGPSWATFVQSRRGYSYSSNESLQFGDALDSSAPATRSPSYMNNPFRAAAGWDLRPSTSGRREVDATLLRPSANGSLDPLFAGNSTQAYRNHLAHPYFRYQGINRLGNLTTTRSNVFAVWVTVGYFEVEPCPADAAHPDGYRLAGELGSDTGDIRRHRAFYIIDRTIPVGYENGRDYNTDQTILLKTHIQ